MMNLRILTLFVWSLLIAACEKNERPAEIVEIGLLLPVSITPSGRTMQRGDTLWLEANFSDSLLDKNSGKRYRIRPQDLNLRSSIVYKRLEGIGRLPTGIAQSFRVVEKVGRAPVGGSTTGLLISVYDGRFYRARIGLIPTQPGITAISMLVSPEGGTSEKYPELPFIQLSPVKGIPQRAVLSNCSYVINEGKATNFDLYSQHTRAFALEANPPPVQVDYELKSTFTVEVK